MTKTYQLTPEQIYEALIDLQKILLDTLDFDKVINKVVNAMLFDLGFVELGYKIIVLTLFDEEQKVLKRIALSQTDEAKRALEASSVPFHEIEIPEDATDNLLIKTLKSKTSMVTHYWPDIFTPILSDEDALKNQHAAEIQTSMLFPIMVRNEAIGVMIFSMIKSETEVTKGEMGLIQGFADIVGLSIENSRLFTSTKKANDELKQLDKLKDEFVSIASHELRTPLTAIKGYLWLALNKSPVPLPEEVTKNLQIAHDASERLSGLVEDMLTTSRIESGRIKFELAPYDIVKLGTEVVNELKVRADEKKITLTLQSALPNLQVTGDKDRIREVMINLIGNALKFTPENGVITLILSQSEQSVSFEVKDTGPGLSKEDISKLFQKFSKLDHSYANTKETGTGLGLYISKQIILLHQGSVSIESELGKGTSFIVKLPLVSHEEKPNNEQQEQQSATPAVTPVQ